MHHISGSPHEQRRISATTRVAAGNAGLSRFSLVCIALVFTLLDTLRQQKHRLPGGVLPELSRKVSKAVEEGGLFRTSCPPPLRGQLKLYKIVPDNFVIRKSRGVK
jgi:hypothetical protein